MKHHHLISTLSLLLGTAALAQQTFNDQTTINGRLWVNPPAANTDAVILEGAGVLRSFLNPGQLELQAPLSFSGADYLSNSAMLPGGLFLNTGREATSSLNRKDWSGLIRLNSTGTLPGMEFYADYLEGTLATAVTGSSPLHYTWHRPLSGSGLSEDISMRSAAIMRLGGVDNALTLMHPSDGTKKIVLNPAAGTLTLNGRHVVTQSDAGSLALGAGTSGTGYASAAFGYMTTASGSMSITSGIENTAAGYASAAIGAWSYAGGTAAMSLGLWASAVGDSSVALAGPNIGASGMSALAAGSWSWAAHDRSAVLGYGLRSTGNGQIILGQWNDFTSPSLPSDLLFIVANGTEPVITPALDGRYTPETNAVKSNAVEVQLSGRTTIRHKNHAATVAPEALNVLGAVTVSRGLTVNGPTAVTGAAMIEGTLNVTGSTGTQGTVSAKKVRIPPGGDLPMDSSFRNHGGLGIP